MRMLDFRRRLHKYPELSFEEHDTQQFIIEVLRSEGIPYRTIAGTGVLAIIEGKRGNHERAVVLRADIDALPIEELNSVEYRSENKGVMHACGHDMHAAILFGVLQNLNRERDFEGTLFGIFQPGEELNPGGASLVLQEEPFKGYNVAAVIGEHVDASLEVGEIGICPGRFMRTRRTPQGDRRHRNSNGRYGYPHYSTQLTRWRGIGGSCNCRGCHKCNPKHRNSRGNNANLRQRGA